MKLNLGKSIAAALLAACVLTALPAGSAVAKPAGSKADSLLFVQQVEGGSLLRSGPGHFRLVLSGVSPRLSTFSDRPERRAGQQGTSAFVHGWAGYGFAADPPNAALVIDRARPNSDVAMLTLTHPRYDRRRQTLVYAAKPLRGSNLPSLSGFSRRGDRVRAHRFGSASLFIDDGGESVYQPVRITVSNAMPGAQISLKLKGNRSEIGWSLGSPFQSDDRFGVNSESGGPLPIASLQVNDSELVISTSANAEGPASQFSVFAYLVAEADTDSFFISSADGPEVEVSVAVGNSYSQTLNPGLTLFSWQ